MTSEGLLALHRGHAHPDPERAAFEDADADEHRRIRRFRLKTIGLPILLYFGLLMIYTVI